jgi:hypothetical protein
MCGTSRCSFARSRVCGSSGKRARTLDVPGPKRGAGPGMCQDQGSTGWACSQLGDQVTAGPRLDVVVVRPAQQREERVRPVLALQRVASLACGAVVNRTASNAKTAREVRHEMEKMWRAHSRLPIRAPRGRMPSRRFRGRQPRGPGGKARSPVRRMLRPGSARCSWSISPTAPIPNAALRGGAPTVCLAALGASPPARSRGAAGRSSSGRSADGQRHRLARVVGRRGA